MVFALLHDLVQRLGHAPPVAPKETQFGMHPAMYALVFGILSGTSLPLAAWLGTMLAPVSDRTCALMMAFGAGALLFAVTVELYGHALHQVALGDLGLFEMFTTIGGALLGGAFYLTINKWLEDYLMSEETPRDEVEDEESVAYTGAASEPLSLEKSKKGGRGSVRFSVEEDESSSVMEALRKQNAHSYLDDSLASMPSENKFGKMESNVSIMSAPLKRRMTWADVRTERKASGRKRKHTILSSSDLQRVRGREKAIRAIVAESAQAESAQCDQEIQHAKSVAFALFLGLLVDGVPEGVLMGFLAAEGHLTPVLIISLFIANFPEAFSSSSLLIQAEMPMIIIMGMWTGLCILVGCLAGLSCWLLLLAFPDYGLGGHSSDLPIGVLLGIALVEGITGGAMIACIAAVMLPEAFERAGKSGPFYQQSGFLCLGGFLFSVALKALCG